MIAFDDLIISSFVIVAEIVRRVVLACNFLLAVMAHIEDFLVIQYLFVLVFAHVVTIELQGAYRN